MRALLLSTILVAVILVSSTLAASSLSVRNSVAITRPGFAGMWFDYVVVIMLENHAIDTTYGSSCLGNCTFFNYLADTYGLADNYDAGGVSGSLGDYIAITSGDGSVTCNFAPGQNGCGPYGDANIVDRIERKHLTWKAYMEDYPTSCGSNCSPIGKCFIASSSSSGHYASIHNPFVYYQDILNNASRCSRIVPANKTILSQSQPCGSKTDPGIVETDDLLLNDLNSMTNVANYTFLTPNTVDDLHDCSSGDVSLGNHYLQHLVPQILDSTLFKSKRAALFVTFDEIDPFNSGRPNIYTVWASRNSSITQPAFKSTLNFNHFSALKTFDDNWGFLGINSTDTSASAMGVFFR
ncbi:MAG TPA: alkaline phosphatase family protein [Candidatus Bathyarchaeia archaeon]|nr:alkaline phosphatase family protein [Candidatus Bathyarchaeia archaeon]